LAKWKVLSRATLDPAEAGAVRQLIADCDARDGLRLKISVYARPSGPDAATTMFLVYDGTRLAGCWSLDHDGGHEAEICGAVLPEYRRHGIGGALFGAARDAVHRQGANTVLLICEDASTTGRAFVAAVHGSLRSKELHMERAGGPVVPALPAIAGVEVRPGTHADVDALVRIMTLAFRDDEAGVRRRVMSEMDDPTMPYLLLSVEGEIVGSLKPYELSGTIGLYAVGVLPERQGHGYGKRLMLGAMEWLGARFPDKPFALEVDPNNAAAIAVYKGVGFDVTTVYGYYAV
jgi:ribosomal protein S18 acetylase RimI-like enzyme